MKDINLHERRSMYRRVVALALVLFLVSSMVAPVFATTSSSGFLAENNSTNTTDGRQDQIPEDNEYRIPEDNEYQIRSNGTNTTQPSRSNAVSSSWSFGQSSNNSSNNSSGDSGGNVIDDTLNYIGNPLDEGKKWISKKTFGPVLNFTIGVPVMGVGWKNPKSGLHSPTEWPYKGLMNWYKAMLIFTFIILLLAVAAAFARAALMTISPYRAVQMLLRAIAAIVGVLGFHLIAFSLVHRLTNSLSHALAPSPEEFLSSGVNIIKTLTGTAVMGGFLKNLGGDAVKWLLIMHVLIWIYLIFFPIISPPIVAVRIFSPRSTWGKISDGAIWLHVALLLSKVITGGLLGLAWGLKWGGSPFKILVNSALSVGILLFAVLVPPLVILGVLYSRSKVVSLAGGAAFGFLTGNRISRAVGRKRKQIWQGTKERGRASADRVRSGARDTATRTRERVQVVKGRSAHGPGGRARTSRIRHHGGTPSGSRRSSVRSWLGGGNKRRSQRAADSWGPKTTSNGGRSAGSRRASSNSQPTAAQIRELGKERDSGATPADRKEYLKLKDGETPRQASRRQSNLHGSPSQTDSSSSGRATAGRSKSSSNSPSPSSTKSNSNSNSKRDRSPSRGGVSPSDD